MPKCAELVATDEERTVVMGALESLTEMLKEIKRPVLQGEGHSAAILNCLKSVLTYKVYYVKQVVLKDKLKLCLDNSSRFKNLSKNLICFLLFLVLK